MGMGRSRRRAQQFSQNTRDWFRMSLNGSVFCFATANSGLFFSTANSAIFSRRCRPSTGLSPKSAGMQERLFFEAFEIQSSVSQPVLRNSIYFSVGDLTELLEPGFANERLVFNKPHLDQGMKKDLADALRSLSERHPKLRRPDQYKMARELPEFRQYRITDRDLREAARKHRSHRAGLAKNSAICRGNNCGGNGGIILCRRN